MNFKILKDGKEINCEIVFTFRDERNDINYMVYTDGSTDEDGELEIYASRYILKNNEFYLTEIENEYEWNLIDNMLEAKYRESENSHE